MSISPYRETELSRMTIAVEQKGAPVFTGLRVLEVANDLGGEIVGKLLAGMGADVLKVELPEGSATRGVGPYVGDVRDPNRSLAFWYYNTNKRSAVLDYRSPAGRDRLMRLILETDVVISTFSPHELKELGLDLSELRSASPATILLSVTPFGLDGPRADWLTSDLVALALGTPLNSCGYDDHSIPPIRPGGDQAAQTASSFALMGLFLALLERQRTGKGQLIDVGMHDCLNVSAELANLFWFYPRVEIHRQTCRAAQPRPTQMAIFQTADDRWVYFAIFVAEDKAWTALLEWLTSKDLALDLGSPEYRDPRYRQEHFQHIQEVVEVFFLTQTADEVYHDGQSRGLPIGPLNAPEDLFLDVHLQERRFFQMVDHGGALGAEYPSLPIHFSAFRNAPVRRAPHLGEHTIELEADDAELRWTGGPRT
jgi:crotonobetainyl-CoA:carnitine CoA-transferase CaiB-like acyl-CoA transferase